MKQDVYTRVTDTILAALEQGTRPWMQPWNAAHAAGPISRPLRHNGKPYSGINTLMLWVTAIEKGYSAPIWMTYKQAQELGAQVKKGEHGSLVVYANTLTRTETNEKTGEDEEIEIPYIKGYTVFNVEQIDGLPAHYYARIEAPHLSDAQRHAKLDAFFAATKADIRHGGNRAFYAIEPDFIQMPPFESFHDPESYYATLAHEQTHWTRHPSRLARDMGRKKWGDAGYAMEELVAEIGSAFLCAELGLTPEIRDDHAAYIASWLTVLKDDKKAIFTAASHAQKAADFLLNLQPAPAPDPEPDAGGNDTPTATIPDSTPEAEAARGSEAEPLPAAGEDPPASGPSVLDGPPVANAPPPGGPKQLSFF
jgi:antirestriction protein ArdC